MSTFAREHNGLQVANQQVSDINILCAMASSKMTKNLLNWDELKLRGKWESSISSSSTGVLVIFIIRVHMYIVWQIGMDGIGGFVM
jgi:hypothetical protein